MHKEETMGEEAAVFTPEEKVILGEETEPQKADPEKPPVEGEAPPEGGEKPPEGEKPPAAKEPEHTEEEKKEVESAGAKIEVDEKGKTWIIDDEGTRIPLKRWRSNYRESQEHKRGKEELERKLNLIKELGQERYYSLYPAEKPANWKPAAAVRTAKEADVFDLVAQYPDPSNPYHGKTLREIYSLDAAEGRRLEREYEKTKSAESEKTRAAAEAAENFKQQTIREANAEVETFMDHLAGEMFSKKADALTPQEKAQVESSIQATLDWMGATKRGAGILADAYFLMNKEKIVADAKTKGGKGALESLQRASVPSINAGGGAATAGMGAFEAMSRDELAGRIADMDEMAFVKFSRQASAALKAKHPDVPWA